MKGRDWLSRPERDRAPKALKLLESAQGLFMLEGNIDRRRGLANPIPHRLNSRTFMQRWCLHILPKGFTKSRWYGGYHGSKRAQYLELCRQLLSIKPDDQAPKQVESESSIESDSRRCPHGVGLEAD